MVAVEAEALLARDEAEALAEFQQEVFDAVDDRLLQIAEPLVALPDVVQREGVPVVDLVGLAEQLDRPLDVAGLEGLHARLEGLDRLRRELLLGDGRSRGQHGQQQARDPRREGCPDYAHAITSPGASPPSRPPRTAANREPARRPGRTGTGDHRGS